MKTISHLTLGAMLLVGMAVSAGWAEIDDLQPPHDETNGISCPTCHVPFGTAPNPPPDSWVTVNVCWSCHIDGGMAAFENIHPVEADTMWCQDCHNPHEHQAVFPQWYIYEYIDTPNSGRRDLAFVDSTDFTHGDPGYYQPYDGVCETCHTQTDYHRNNASGNHTHNAGSNCVTCHQHTGGFLAECGSCHAIPPQSGAHQTHFGGPAEAGVYGETENLSTATEYVFQCGNCHALDLGNHNNGVVDLELYNPSSPPGSLKSMNPPTAAYAPGSTVYYDPDGLPYTYGTCSNVYCHSRTDWASPDSIPAPIMSGGLYVLDANGNFTYAPYTVTESKVYSNVNWGSSALDCDGCHRNMPQTSDPEVQAGVGNTHSWIDDIGYDNMHSYNMSFDPLICRVCHYGTVTETQTWSRDPVWGIATYGPAAIANKAYHVDGLKEVVIDTVNLVTYSGWSGNNSYSLAQTTYNPVSRTCTNAPCHYYTGPQSSSRWQLSPQWGLPYRWFTNECDVCHRYGGGWPEPPPGPQGGSGSSQVENEHPTPIYGQPCSDCHTGHISGAIRQK